MRSRSDDPARAGPRPRPGGSPAGPSAPPAPQPETGAAEHRPAHRRLMTHPPRCCQGPAAAAPRAARRARPGCAFAASPMAAPGRGADSQGPADTRQAPCGDLPQAATKPGLDVDSESSPQTGGRLKTLESGPCGAPATKQQAKPRAGARPAVFFAIADRATLQLRNGSALAINCLQNKEERRFSAGRLPGPRPQPVPRIFCIAAERHVDGSTACLPNSGSLRQRMSFYMPRAGGWCGKA